MKHEEEGKEHQKLIGQIKGLANNDSENPCRQPEVVLVALLVEVDFLRARGEVGGRKRVRNFSLQFIFS